MYMYMTAAGGGSLPGNQGKEDFCIALSNTSSAHGELIGGGTFRLGVAQIDQ